MKPGDLVRVRIPLDAHPREDPLDGIVVLILGEVYKTSGVPGEYVKGLGG